MTAPKMTRAQRSESNKACAALLEEVRAERARQDDKWGVQDLPCVDPVLAGRAGGCSPERMAEEYGVPTEARAKFLCQAAQAKGEHTFAHVVVEELCEAIGAAAAGDEEATRKEALQLAAVCVQWAACIDRRRRRRAEAQEAAKVAEVSR